MIGKTLVKGTNGNAWPPCVDTRYNNFVYPFLNDQRWRKVAPKNHVRSGHRD